MKSFHFAVFPADGIGAAVIAASRQVLSKLAETAHGGHLLEARVYPTCELVLTESPAHLQKQVDPDSGFALIRL